MSLPPYSSKQTASREFAWPNGARIAVVVTCLWENWSGDKGPPFSVQTTSLKPGTHDRAAMTWGTYGTRNGVWRLLKILNEHQAPSTFVANAQSMEFAPDAVEHILKSGHEIAAHSYTQDALMAYLKPDEERAMVEKCVAVFNKLTGAPPKGWLSPVLAPTADTEEIIADAGFLWYGDYNNIDLPFCVDTKKGMLVALPHTDFADHRVLRANPRDWFEVYKDTFDYLYANEPMPYLNITVHCHFGGRPLMAAQVDRILRYVRGFPGVWLARHDELAQWVKDNQIGEWTNQQRFFGHRA
ncbi:MAG TPA: polysaccharide deacetylase family protein [Bradyrhizobium sp.]|uniref:polysaccharide deacetylase family protein n=1 Tax=Bradyrhizobium sp. TaxID=376 RepID=UPI002D7F201B|nr:polysaccharide deacetylase family protein [Bradyrhizobium sp.]HET7886442.1 polysaccharide deacetylase family protein [Bradyrhizobium sp.]